MSTLIRVERTASPPHPDPDTFLCGFAEVDITPHPGFPLAGFSAEAERGDGVRGHLFARALYLRDEAGEDVALVVVDLMSGSRLLLELVAEHTRARCGLSVDRVFLHGTHTHTGPSWFYGNSLYDELASKPGFDLELVTWMAGRIADAIVAARNRARPGGIAIDGETRVWGASRNRSLPAFMKNPGAADWNTTGPGADPPTLSDDERHVDPRLLVIVARHDRGTGVFAFFGCHSTTIGHELAYYSADWPGFAARTARGTLTSELNSDVLVAVGIRATGDVNGFRDGLTPYVPPGPQLEERVGSMVGVAIVNTVTRVLTRVKPEPITVWFAEPRVDDTAWQTHAGTILAKRWFFGAPTIAGSEESRTWFHTLGLAREGRTNNTFPKDHPQHPKARALGLAQNLIQKLLKLDPSKHHPLIALRIGPTLLVGLPGEPTITAAYNIELALKPVASVTTVAVLHTTGDYGGYFATRPEYQRQHYEGSSTLFGRDSAPYLQARLVELVGADPVPASAGTIEFSTVSDKHAFHPDDAIVAGVDPDPEWTSKTAGDIAVRWLMPEKARVVFGNGWWVRLEEETAGTWAPVMLAGRQLDDVNYPILIRRIKDGFFDFDDSQRWALSFDLPVSLPTANRRIMVAPRSGFAGFAMEIPQ